MSRIEKALERVAQLKMVEGFDEPTHQAPCRTETGLECLLDVEPLETSNQMLLSSGETSAAVNEEYNRLRSLVVKLTKGDIFRNTLLVTSTVAGESGMSFGWINRELIASGKPQPHINVFGGEDRFWLGPEGGQYSIFFAKDAQFDLSDWFTPAAIDTMPYEVARQSKSSATFRAEFAVTNYSGTRFDVKVDREVKLLSTKRAAAKLGVKIGTDAKVVAYETVNKITNAGNCGAKIIVSVQVTAKPPGFVGQRLPRINLALNVHHQYPDPASISRACIIMRGTDCQVRDAVAVDVPDIGNRAAQSVTVMSPLAKVGTDALSAARARTSPDSESASSMRKTREPGLAISRKSRLTSMASSPDDCPIIRCHHIAHRRNLLHDTSRKARKKFRPQIFPTSSAL